MLVFNVRYYSLIVWWWWWLWWLYVIKCGCGGGVVLCGVDMVMSLWI